MTFRRHAPTILIVAVIVVIAGVTALSGRLFSGLTTSVERGQFRLMQSIVSAGLRDAADRALAQAELVAALPATRRLVAAQDRDGLLAEFAPMFESQRERHGVDQAQFHLPPATSLLRLHNPPAFGDDLTRFRPMVVAVNREQASRKGLAIARRGPAVFGVAPVSDLAGRHLGSFETGLDFGAILVALKVAYGLEFTLFVEEKPLREFAAGVNPAVLADQNRLGRFIRFQTTNGALMAGLVGDADIASVGEPTTYIREADRATYGVLLHPLRDAAGQSISIIAAASDFSGSREAAGRSLVWQLCLAVFAVVILSGLIVVVVRGVLLRPLGLVSERFTAISAGGPAQIIPNEESFCEELRPLVRLNNRIAERRAKERAP